jgi:hypothetical protein
MKVKLLVLYKCLFFNFVDWFTAVLHGDRCNACREACWNFTDGSACLMTDNVGNEVITIQTYHTFINKAEYLKVYSLAQHFLPWLPIKIFLKV